MKNLILVIVLIAIRICVPIEDEVHFAVPDYGNNKFYSGLLDFDTGNFHYVFFDSQRDPDNDPLVLWLNGGPGCSSLIGMSYQNGPFLFKEGTVNFQINPYAWNMKANLLYIESPGGVGFSHTNRTTNPNDDTTTQDNYKALLKFFEKFPNLKKNQFYITGESYAGVYVPYLAHYIILKNSLPNRQMTFNLKGIMIGSACTDPRECYQPGHDPSQFSMGIYQYEHLYNHGFYTQRDFNDVKATCWMGYTSDACIAVRKILDKKFDATNTSRLNLYAKCLYQKVKVNQGKKSVVFAHGQLPVMDDDVICEDMYGIQHFFNQVSVQSAFHLPFRRFDACSQDVNSNYKMSDKASYFLYPDLIKAGLRIWITVGDVDGSVPVVGTLQWIERLRIELGLPILEQWRGWWTPGLHKWQDQMTGMVWKLKGLTFVSIKGAGHMMPKDKPKEASVLLSCFLNNRDLPQKYVDP